MLVPFVNFHAQYEEEKEELMRVAESVLAEGFYVGGPHIEEFETDIARYHGSRCAVGVSSGTSALAIALKALSVGPGDEVITAPNSFISSASAIVSVGATPVFADVGVDQNMELEKVQSRITSKTKAIMPVHLTGRMTDIDQICKLAKSHNLAVVEDAAQAIGSCYDGKQAGTFGRVGCFSAHPLKNLNAVGDSGYLTTNNEKIYIKTKDLINHGMTSNRNIIKNFGHVSRMDNLQAAVLNYRLTKLKKVISIRRKNVELYKKYLDLKNVLFPKEEKYQFNSYHTFVIQVARRNDLKKYLLKNGISTAVHYPIPIHLQPASKFLRYNKGSFPMAEMQAKKILTLPINQFLKVREIYNICKHINKFYSKK